MRNFIVLYIQIQRVSNKIFFRKCFSMPHPYLSFSDSIYYPGFLVVGTSSYSTEGNALTNENVKNIEIPSSFEGKTIAEIGAAAFFEQILNLFSFRRRLKRLNTARSVIVDT